MATPVPPPIEQSREHARSKGAKYRRGILYGVLPLSAVVAIIAVAVMLAALERLLIGVSAFLLQQQVVLVTLGSGLILALVAFTLALIFTLRRVAEWQRNGPIECAQAALWTLVVSSAVILLPTALALVLPLH